MSRLILGMAMIAEGVRVKVEGEETSYYSILHYDRAEF